MKLSILVRSGRSAEALGFARTLAEQLKEDPEELSSIAYQLLSPYGLRDPAAAAFAMQIATKANDLAGGRDAIILNTLARAYFVQGNAAQAVEAQRKAVEQADDPQMKAQLTRILEAYRSAGR
jgi:tetratricopeptide (TPR) repeat protein